MNDLKLNELYRLVTQSFTTYFFTKTHNYPPVVDQYTVYYGKNVEKEGINVQLNKVAYYVNDARVELCTNKNKQTLIKIVFRIG